MEEENILTLCGWWRLRGLTAFIFHCELSSIFRLSLVKFPNVTVVNYQGDISQFFHDSSIFLGSWAFIYLFFTCSYFIFQSSIVAVSKGLNAFKVNLNIHFQEQWVECRVKDKQQVWKMIMGNYARKTSNSLILLCVSCFSNTSERLNAFKSSDVSPMMLSSHPSLVQL